MNHSRGFTLVELSIVLVILGLLVGGVLSGQSLIRAAELRSVTSEFQSFVTAAHTFRDKYFAYPGDIANATDIWGTAANCPGDASQGSTTPATCNGDGNGRIDNSANSSEFFRFWQQLANAGLVEGSYSGVTTQTGYYIGTGHTNSPSSRISKNAVWFTLSENNLNGASNGNFFRYDFHPRLTISGINTGSWASVPVLTPSEAYNIDAKMDDGRPGRGKVTARVGSNCTDAANSAAFDANYVLTHTAATCYLNMIF